MITFYFDSFQGSPSAAGKQCGSLTRQRVTSADLPALYLTLDATEPAEQHGFEAFYFSYQSE